MIMNIPNILWKSAWKYLVSPRVCYVFKDYAEVKNNFEIFSQARELYIYAGELFSDYYNDPRFIESLGQAVQAGCQVQVIFGPALYADNERFFHLACDPQAKFQFYKRPYRDDAHFKIIVNKQRKKWAVVDRKHPIGAGSEGRWGSVLLLRGYDHEINALIRKFKQQQEKCTAIPPCALAGEFSQMQESDGKYSGFIVAEDGKVKLADAPKVRELADTFNKICALR
jgi:hypothetical protein